MTHQQHQQTILQLTDQPPTTELSVCRVEWGISRESPPTDHIPRNITGGKKFEEKISGQKRRKNISTL